VKAECGQDAAGKFACRRVDSNLRVLDDIAYSPPNGYLATLGRNRFYGFIAFGKTRNFKEGSSFAAGDTNPRDFDTARLTDRNAASPTGGDLVDVSDVACDVSGACTGTNPHGASGDAYGWVFEYRDDPAAPTDLSLTHKTAGGASILASCVLWNSVFPLAGAANSVCATDTAKARFHQSDYLSGLPTCAAGFKRGSNPNDVWARYDERGIIAPPPEPASAIQISKTGQIKYSSLLVEPGQQQATEASVSVNNDVMQTVYELPVSKSMHQCRHVAGAAPGDNCVPVAP
jgi:type IV pilus assembly protein PilY1